jgi:uncharacterized OB-fold protein
MSRAAAMRPMDEAAAAGKLAVQHCADCGAAQYPPRELCHHCLSAELVWTVVDTMEATVLATTPLHHSNEPAWRPHLPVRIGLVQLHTGPRAVCFIPEAEPGTRVTLRASLDDEGRAVMTAHAVP